MKKLGDVTATFFDDLAKITSTGLQTTTHVSPRYDAIKFCDALGVLHIFLAGAEQAIKDRQYDSMDCLRIDIQEELQALVTIMDTLRDAAMYQDKYWGEK